MKVSHPRARILIVDDLPEKLLVYRTLLEDLEAQIVEAHSGTEALKRVLESEFAVILLDVNMPDLNGYEVCRRLKSDPATAPIPVIFLSATDKKTAAIEKGIAAGAETFLFSPIDSDQLLAVLHGTMIKHATRKSNSKRSS